MDGEVDQARISDILEQFFGARASWYWKIANLKCAKEEFHENVWNFKTVKIIFRLWYSCLCLCKGVEASSCSCQKSHSFGGGEVFAKVSNQTGLLSPAKVYCHPEQVLIIQDPIQSHHHLFITSIYFVPFVIVTFWPIFLFNYCSSYWETICVQRCGERESTNNIYESF